jgi:acetyltransferase
VKLFRELNFKLNKPVIYGTAGATTDMRNTCAQLAAINVVPFKSPERSARAMLALVQDAKHQYRLARRRVGKPSVAVTLPPGALDEAQGKLLLNKIGIPAPRSVICRTHAEAIKTLSNLRKPLAAKILNAAILHKTEAGGVHLNIRDEKQLSAALQRIDKIRCTGKRRYLIEEMAGPGLDLIVGGLRDAVFGPVVLLGMGGTMAEALKDVSMRLAPLQPADAEEMIAELKAGVLFRGWRGSPVIKRRAVIDALLSVSNLLIDNPRIRELDINPLRATAKGVLALDALIVKQS